MSLPPPNPPPPPTFPRLTTDPPTHPDPLSASDNEGHAGPFAFSDEVRQAQDQRDIPPTLTFPRPVDPTPPLAGLYDAHTHTPLCQHATGEITAYAAVAKQRGLAGLTVTCHNPLPDGYAADIRMREDQLDEYVAMVDAARRACEGQLDIRLGLEADYVPGYELYVEKQLADHPFDFVIGSVHPQVPAYQEKFYLGDTFEFQQLYFEHLAASAETGLFDSLAHPDLIKQLMPRRWSVSKILDDVCRSLDRIAATGVAMEVNTSGWRKPLPEPCPGPRILYEMARRRIPVTLGSDAHSPDRVAFHFEKALRLLSAAGYRHVSVFHERKRLQLPLADAAACLVAPAAAATTNLGPA